MPIAKFLTSPKLFEYLDVEVKEALKRHGILSLFDYAWLNEYDPDPEYIGLFKWSNYGFHSLFQLHVLSRSDCEENFYTQDQFESLSTICRDLEALMDVSRLAIGNALWMADMVKADAFDHHHHFWLNHISSVTLLGMVSDRIRDLFLQIVFDESFDDYRKARRAKNIGEHQPNHYQYSFHDASSLSKMERCTSQLVAIQHLAKAIYVERQARNDTVHEVATQAGILTKKWFEDPSIETFVRLKKSFHDTSEVRIKVQDLHLHTIDSSLKAVTEWYQNLVRAASHVFDIEYVLRNSKNSYVT